MILALLILASNPLPLIVDDSVDEIELNHVVDSNTGSPVLSQWIFWEGRGDRQHVRAWRLHHGEKIDGLTLLWHDGMILRRVTGKIFKETWTLADPEVADREALPMELRWHLFEAIRTGRPVDVTR